jgi:hypothetical protein
MSHTYSKSTSITDESRFNEESAPSKACADGLLYKTADLYIHGTPLIISGPDYFKHVKRGFMISRKPKVKHEQVILIDIDPKVGRILRRKREKHRKLDPEKAKKVKILSGPIKGNIVNAKSERLEDLDLMETWNGRANSRGLSAGNIFNIRTRKQLETYPGTGYFKCLMFTSVLRNSAGGKATFTEGLNRDFLKEIEAEVEGFEFTPRCPSDKGPWDRTDPMSKDKDVFVYQQTPIWKKRGRVVKMRVFTYHERQKTPMITGVIIWR